MFHEPTKKGIFSVCKMQSYMTMCYTEFDDIFPTFMSILIFLSTESNIEKDALM